MISLKVKSQSPFTYIIKSLVFFLFLIGLSNCGASENKQSKLIQESYNPSQTAKVIIFENLGDTNISNSLHISIVDEDYELSNEETGNIYKVDQYSQNLDVKKILVHINWVNDNYLEITHNSKIKRRILRIETKAETKIGKIKIKYIYSEI